MKEKVKKPIFKKWWFWLFVIIVIAVIGANTGDRVATVSKSDFEKLEKGMSYDEVKKIVGGTAKEEKVNSVNSEIVEYVFDDEEGSKVSLLFVKDKLDFKFGFEEVTETASRLKENDNVNETHQDQPKDEKIKKIVEGIIEEDFNKTTISQLLINENMALDDGSYIVLPHLKWNVQNGAKTTVEMLEMYSDNLAAQLADYEVSELTVFWEVPYHLEGDNIAKFNYVRKGDNMIVGEHWIAPKIK